MAETNTAELQSLFVKFQPQEVLLPEGETFDTPSQLSVFITHRSKYAFTATATRKTLTQTYGRKATAPFTTSHQQALIAAGALLSYVKETQQEFLPHLKAPQPYHSEEFVFLDPQTQRNLELVETILEGTQAGSLLSVLDTSRTRMGHRRFAPLVAASASFCGPDSAAA